MQDVSNGNGVHWMMREQLKRPNDNDMEEDEVDLCYGLRKKMRVTRDYSDERTSNSISVNDSNCNSGDGIRVFSMGINYADDGNDLRMDDVSMDEGTKTNSDEDENVDLQMMPGHGQLVPVINSNQPKIILNNSSSGYSFDDDNCTNRLVYVSPQGTDETRFTRDNDDYCCTLSISLSQALLGFTAVVPVGGELLNLPVLECEALQADVLMVIAGKGAVNLNDPSQRGNLRLQFNVHMPTRLDSIQRQYIRRINI